MDYKAQKGSKELVKGHLSNDPELKALNNSHLIEAMQVAVGALPDHEDRDVLVVASGDPSWSTTDAEGKVTQNASPSITITASLVDRPVVEPKHVLTSEERAAGVQKKRESYQTNYDQNVAAEKAQERATGQNPDKSSDGRLNPGYPAGDPRNVQYPPR